MTRQEYAETAVPARSGRRGPEECNNARAGGFPVYNLTHAARRSSVDPGAGADPPCQRDGIRRLARPRAWQVLCGLHGTVALVGRGPGRLLAGTVGLLRYRILGVAHAGTG